MQVELHFKIANEAVLRQRFRTKTHPLIQAVCWGLSFWLWTTYNIIPTVTCLWRSESENKADGGKPTSRHLEIPSKAVDIRTKDLKPEVVTGIEEYLKNTWGDLLYVLVEDSHLHLHLSRKAFPNGSLK